jgi:hypothetical protein
LRQSRFEEGPSIQKVEKSEKELPIRKAEEFEMA